MTILISGTVGAVIGSVLTIAVMAVLQVASNDEELLKTERTHCIMCGGANSVVGTRAKINGHFHGKCEKCGAVYME
ncbi:MAG: hypothetical protein PUD92_04225 [Clostridiales bacterium]|nr:hypothetical protein [Clostridiales bacterium]